MFSEQALAYMDIPMTTSSQAWTAPALHSDMHVFLVSSACWRRSRCSSPSDRLCCGLSESGLVRRSHGVAFRRRFRVRKIWKSTNVTHLDTIEWQSRDGSIKSTSRLEHVSMQSDDVDATFFYFSTLCFAGWNRDVSIVH